MTHYDLAWSSNLDPEVGILVAALLDSTREWRENLESPSPAAVVWQPFENGPSIGGLLLHMSSCELYWLEQVATGVKSSVENPAVIYDQILDQDKVLWPTPPAEPFEWYLSNFEQTRAQVLELIGNHNDPSRLYQGPHSSATYRWMLAHVVEHDSYHGGQAVLLHEMHKKMHS